MFRDQNIFADDISLIYVTKVCLQECYLFPGKNFVHVEHFTVDKILVDINSKMNFSCQINLVVWMKTLTVQYYVSVIVWEHFYVLNGPVLCGIRSVFNLVKKINHLRRTDNLSRCSFQDI